MKMSIGSKIWITGLIILGAFGLCTTGIQPFNQYLAYAGVAWLAGGVIALIWNAE